MRFSIRVWCEFLISAMIINAFQINLLPRNGNHSKLPLSDDAKFSKFVIDLLG